jgi:outer membrane protein assembly factor BamD (BamD/ComL family)
MKTAAVLLVALLTLAGCRTSIDSIEQDLTPEQYFQKAIEATDNNNFRLAMAYYQSFLEKYPDDLARNLWASYEVAFLHYKMGNESRALELFDELIARYEEADEEAGWPQGPLVLAVKVKGNILAERRTDQTATGS